MTTAHRRHQRAADLATVSSQLSRAGCVAADDEAAELAAAADGDVGVLDDLVDRRCSGVPLAWLTGSVVFCGVDVFVDPGVYVPRPQSEPLAAEGRVRLPPGGVAVDLCTGSGAIAVVLGHRRPRTRVLGTEIDPVAVTCARRNGVEVVVGDMADGLSSDLDGQVDVVTAVVPYVPTEHLRVLPRDVLAFEPRAALDGGERGTDFLASAVAASARLLHSGGSLLLEMGGEQDDVMVPQLDAFGFCDVERHVDEDGELRALYCRRRA